MVFKDAYMSRRVIGIVAVIATCAVFGWAGDCYGKSQRATEYQIKAAYIYNFAKFVDWPSKAFPNANSPIIIGVLGEDPFGDALEQAVKDKTVNGRKLQVKRFDNVRNVEHCHILFISASEKMRLSKALERAKGLNVLTVSDIGGFARRGGIIGFTTERNKVGFEINVDAAKKAELTVSSQLLKLAKVVGG